jgi:signal transduction histidine kinase
VRIEVEDRGAGIAAADLPQVGHQLFRGLATHHIPGSGLGLAMVGTIVARLGGKLVIASKEGAGTVATIRLPAVQSLPLVVLGLEEERDGRAA